MTLQYKRGRVFAALSLTLVGINVNVDGRLDQAFDLAAAATQSTEADPHNQTPSPYPTPPGLDDGSDEDSFNFSDPDGSGYSSPSAPQKRIISEIEIQGNTFTSPEAIRHYIPYKVGLPFDRNKTSLMIKSIYYGLKRFRNISVLGEDVGSDKIRLIILVEEKQPIKQVYITGNNNLPIKDIQKKIDIELPAADSEELKSLAEQVKKLYAEKGYNDVSIETKLEVKPDGKAIAIFTVVEGKRALIKQIEFEGNESVTSKQLRQSIFSKEDWILGVLDRSGVYHPERLEGDKYAIEQLYQNSGFLNAKVANVRIEKVKELHGLKLVFEIEEGDRYHIGTVQTPGNDVLPEEVLRAFVPLRTGMLYSREAVGNTIKTLEKIWGNYGYIFAHVDPSIQPNEEEKTVDISFHSEIGNKVRLNKITIKGNRKTRDKVIRRNISLQEGEPITNSQMEGSKQSVETLGYFTPKEGVNWKTRRIDSETADLDLIIEEAKTGSLSAQLTFGGAALSSPASGMSLKASARDSNLLGTGIDMSVEGSWAKGEKTINFHIAQPWLFDRPMFGSFDAYHRRPTYDDLRNIEGVAIYEKLTGGKGTLGWIYQSRNFFNGSQLLASLGTDNIQYERKPVAHISSSTPENMFAETYQKVLDRRFAEGTYFWFAGALSLDRRNHPMHPSRGHRIHWDLEIGLPTFGNDISYYRSTMDVSWLTPLIGERDLVLKLHAYLGFTGPLMDKNIPYGKLFHVGGDKSVRGFLFGQIGPRFLGDPIGAKRAFWVNAELIFPITADLNMKGVLFYDGGAGFHTAYENEIRGTNCKVPHPALMQNGFDYRHSVGFGVRLLSPVPVRIDWGFKVDPRRNRRDPRRDESASEVHFGMNYDW